MADQNPNSSSVLEEKTVKAPNLLERVKEEMEAIDHHEKLRKSQHHKETHGTSDDIDQNTPINDIKGPGFFQRLKEEIEAIFNAATSKLSSKN